MFCLCSRPGVRMTEPAEKAQDTLEADVDAAIALCDGDVRAALRAALVYNDFLERKLETKARDRVTAKQVLATVFGVDPENYENMQTAIFTALACTSKPQLLSRKSVDLMITMKPTIMAP